MSAARFKLEVGNFRKEIDKETRQAYHDLCSIALERIVNRTPVLTGRAASSWTVSIGANKILKSVRKGFNPSNAKRLSIGLGRKVLLRLLKMKRFKNVYLTNNAPYISDLEEGSSRKAPNGMVRITINELRSHFSSLRRRIIG